MISGVTCLNIKPVRKYSDNKDRNTTITGFDDILNSQKDKISDKTDEKKAEEKEDNAAENMYKDPVTGKSVKYVDVADNDKTDVNNTSSAGAAQTTSASSMKKTKYDAYFKEAAKKYNVSESLLKAIAKAESNFNANDVSSAGAMGVMQLMPSTAESLGVDDPYDPRQNIMGGAKCIAQKLKEFNGDVKLALAAYNAGSGAVRRSGGIPSYCKSYVNKVLSYKEAYETAGAVG